MDIYYKKADGEIFKFERGKMKQSSCDAKFVKCDMNGNPIKEDKKPSKKKGAK
tara:strand:- start:142 stop:300 length:159 start_codon:yes stop_codon:yes gene_type:complete